MYYEAPTMHNAEKELAIASQAEQFRKERTERINKEGEVIKVDLETKLHEIAPDIKFAEGYLTNNNSLIHYTTARGHMVSAPVSLLDEFARISPLSSEENELPIHLLELSSKSQFLSFKEKFKLFWEGNYGQISQKEMTYDVRIQGEDTYQVYADHTAEVEGVVRDYCSLKGLTLKELSFSKGSLEVIIVILEIPNFILNMIELTNRIRQKILDIKARLRRKMRKD
ncbi:MAG: hypothetical protein Roseis2KO_30130 [Roseivirga sp.]